jgi:polysaccharide pyruvyl transferase WcaK-like protein
MAHNKKSMPASLERQESARTSGQPLLADLPVVPIQKLFRLKTELTQPEFRRVGLLEHMGGGNLGDDATVDAVMQNIRSRWPGAVICGFSMNAEDTRQRHQIPAYPIRRMNWSQKNDRPRGKPGVKESITSAVRRHSHLLKLAKAINRVIRGPLSAVQEIAFLSRSFSLLRQFDLLVISGGGQLTEAWGGPWGFPYTLFKWTLIARLCDVKCYYINVGAGPLKQVASRFFVRGALRLADYVSFRDEDSRALVRNLGFKQNAEVAPDCAYSLRVPALRSAGEGHRTGRTVGFSPMAYCDPRVYWEKDQPVYERVRETFVRFGSWLNRSNYQLRLFSTDIWFDSTVLDEIEAALKQAAIPHPECVLRERVSQVQEVLARMEQMDYIVTCRYHGVIFAHMLKKPVLALSHHPKVTALMKSLGLSEYCIDLRQCDASLLEERFSLLVKNQDAVIWQLQESLSRYKAALSRQFDSLFSRRLIHAGR